MAADSAGPSPAAVPASLPVFKGNPYELRHMGAVYRYMRKIRYMNCPNQPPFLEV